LLLTGARREEIAGITGSEVTRHADGSATWVLPAERSKNRRPNQLILPPMIASLLPVGQGQLFAGGASWSRYKRRLDAALAAAGHLMPPWVLHDLRRTFVTRLNDMQVEPHVVEALVNHVSGPAKRGVAGVYNLSAYSNQKRVALERWCAHIAVIVGSNLPVERANVVELRRP
jgi:integrase